MEFTYNEVVPYVLAALLTGVILDLVKRIVTDWFENKKRKKRRRIWIKTLRSDGIIDACIKEFEKIESPQSFSWSFGSAVLGVILFFILKSTIDNLIRDTWLSMAYSTLICSIISCFFVGIIGRHIIQNGKRGKMELLNKSEKIVNRNMGVRWFTIIIISLTIFFILIIYFGSRNVNTQNLDAVNSILMFSLCFCSATLAHTFVNHKDLIKYIKPLLNSKYSENFPTIKIVTSATELYGKLEYIFGEELISVLDGGVTKVIEWDKIIALELEKRRMQKD